MVASDVAAALAELARVENCTQLVLGASRRSRWAELTRGSVINRVDPALGPDRPARHLAGQGRRARAVTIARAGGSSGGASALSPRRRLAGLAIAVDRRCRCSRSRSRRCATTSRWRRCCCSSCCWSSRPRRSGGPMLAIGTAVVAFLCANYYFTPPLHQFTIEEHENVLALIVFLVVAGVVSAFVDAAARRARDAARAARRRRDARAARGERAAGRSARRPRRVRALVVRARRRERARRATATSEWHTEAAAGSAAARDSGRRRPHAAARRRRRARARGRPAHRRRPPGAQRVRRAAHGGARAGAPRRRRPRRRPS